MSPDNILERSRAADQIFYHLKAQILSGAYPKGTRLPTERELAELYSVSPPTAREAVRGLALLGLVTVRHGSGAYVSASAESIVAMSLGAVMQLEEARISDVFGVLRVLNEYAAACAVERATAADIDRLRSAAEALQHAQSAEKAAADVRAFHSAVAAAAHNPLLSVLCSFLGAIQAEFAREVLGSSVKDWEKVFAGLWDVRMRFVRAIERRDAKAAMTCSSEFHRAAEKIITTLPKAKAIRLSDPELAEVLTSVLGRVEAKFQQTKTA